MPYGLHWEWRGFGELETAARDRLESCSPVGGEDSCVDRYVLVPDRRVNLKYRAWLGGQSLKVKRLVERDAERGVELWLENPAEDFRLPLDVAATARVLEALGVAGTAAVPVERYGDWEALLRRAASGARTISVAKRRRAFVYRAGETPVRVEVTEITEPERITSVGLEDQAGLSEESPRALVRHVADAVAAARDELDLGLPRLSYLDALAIWGGGGRLATQ